MGVKLQDSISITNQIFSLISQYIISRTRVREGEDYQIIPALTLNISLFEKCTQEALTYQNYHGEQHLKDFRIACDVISKRRSVIVLLGGASGTGKSTLSSLLASRLGISSMLSTDSIRHILRNIIPREQLPILFCSTYEAGNFVDPTNLSPAQSCIQGYIEQSEKVYEYLEKVVEDYHSRFDSIVIEGVHLNVGVIKRLMKKYNSCIPFIVLIKSKKKHMERFSVRSKYMTLDPTINKYVASFPNIREIQKRFVVKADECLIPKVDNSNLDRSLGLCHATIVRCMRLVSKGEAIFDIERNQTFIVHEEYNFVAKNIWSSKLAHEMIKTKVNKGELFKRFFKSEIQGLTTSENFPELKEIKSEDSSSDSPDIGSIISGSVDYDIIHPLPLVEILEHPLSRESVRSRSSNEASDLNEYSQENSSYNSQSDHSVHEDAYEISDEQLKYPKTHHRQTSY